MLFYIFSFSLFPPFNYYFQGLQGLKPSHTLPCLALPYRTMPHLALPCLTSPNQALP